MPGRRLWNRMLHGCVHLAHYDILYIGNTRCIWRTMLSRCYVLTSCMQQMSDAMLMHGQFIHEWRLSFFAEIERIQKGETKKEPEKETYLDLFATKNLKLKERVLIPTKQYPKVCMSRLLETWLFHQESSLLFRCLYLMRETRLGSKYCWLTDQMDFKHAASSFIACMCEYARITNFMSTRVGQLVKSCELKPSSCCPS